MILGYAVLTQARIQFCPDDTEQLIGHFMALTATIGTVEKICRTMLAVSLDITFYVLAVNAKAGTQLANGTQIIYNQTRGGV